MSGLSNSILKTLAFFDAQDLPLTLLEIKNYLETASPVRGIQNALETELADQVLYRQGFYCLKGREGLIGLRKKRYRLTLSRFRKSKKVLRYLRFIPFVRSVAISGSHAFLNSHEGSDTDLLIVTKRQRIWLTRMLVSAYFHVLGQRRHKSLTKNRFCLNHYLDEDLFIERDHNLYTAVEYASLLPVLGNEVWKKFQERNHWLKDYLARPQPELNNVFFSFQFSLWQKVQEIILEITFLAPLLNWLGRIYQKARIKKQEYVLVSECELSFHPESKGQQVLAKFRETLETLST